MLLAVPRSNSRGISYTHRSYYLASYVRQPGQLPHRAHAIRGCRLPVLLQRNTRVTRAVQVHGHPTLHIPDTQDARTRRSHHPSRGCQEGVRMQSGKLRHGRRIGSIAGTRQGTSGGGRVITRTRSADPEDHQDKHPARRSFNQDSPIGPGGPDKVHSHRDPAGPEIGTLRLSNSSWKIGTSLHGNHLTCLEFLGN